MIISNWRYVYCNLSNYLSIYQPGGVQHQWSKYYYKSLRLFHGACRTGPSIYLSIYLSTYLPIYLSIYMSIYLVESSISDPYIIISVYSYSMGHVELVWAHLRFYLKIFFWWKSIGSLSDNWGISTSICVKKLYFHCPREKWLTQVQGHNLFWGQWKYRFLKQ